MTKTEKRFLAILLTGVGVMIAAGIAVVLLTMYRLIWSNPFRSVYKELHADRETGC